MLDTIRANAFKACYIRPIVYRGYDALGVNPLGLPGRFGHPDVGVGRVPRQGGARSAASTSRSARGRARRRTPSRRSRRARPTTPTRSSSRWRRSPTATAKASRSTPPATSARAAARTSSSSATRSSTRRRSRRAILPGITRDSVITIARDLGFQVREELLPREMLYIADEVFFVGTAVEITPIRSVDKIVVGKGRRGPVTEALQTAFFDIINGVRPDTHGWLTYVSPSAQEKRLQSAHASQRSAEDCRRVRGLRPAPQGRQLPDDAGQWHPPRRQRRKAARPQRHRSVRERALHARAPGEVPEAAGGRPRLQRDRPRPLPLQRLPAARHRRHGAARHPDARPDDRRARAPAGPQAHRRGGARPRPRHRHDRQRQEHDAGGDDRPHQLDARGAHHDRRGPDRVSSTGTTSRSSTSARSRSTRASFSHALRSALRQDPDVILVGEMRDFETIETALLAAETGHLVFSTLHTLDATETINRIIAVFPPHQQRQIRIQLATRAQGRGLAAPHAARRRPRARAGRRGHGRDALHPRLHRRQGEDAATSMAPSRPARPSTGCRRSTSRSSASTSRGS